MNFLQIQLQLIQPRSPCQFFCRRASPACAGALTTQKLSGLPGRVHWSAGHRRPSLRSLRSLLNLIVRRSILTSVLFCQRERWERESGAICRSCRPGCSVSPTCCVQTSSSHFGSCRPGSPAAAGSSLTSCEPDRRVGRLHDPPSVSQRTASGRRPSPGPPSSLQPKPSCRLSALRQRPAIPQPLLTVRLPASFPLCLPPGPTCSRPPTSRSRLPSQPAFTACRTPAAVRARVGGSAVRAQLGAPLLVPAALRSPRPVVGWRRPDDRPVLSWESSFLLWGQERFNLSAWASSHWGLGAPTSA